MTETIENQMHEAHEILEGEYLEQHNQQKLFKNLSAASDFILSFGIRNYQIQDGNTQDGQYTVQVSYQRIQ